MEAARLDRHCDDVVVVVGMGGAKAGRTPGVTPCLTRNRAALGFYGPWTPHDFGRAIQIARNPPQSVALRGGYIRQTARNDGGERPTLNMLERLLVRMSRACGLPRRSKDRWQHRQRIRTTWLALGLRLWRSSARGSLRSSLALLSCLSATALSLARQHAHARTTQRAHPIF